MLLVVVPDQAKGTADVVLENGDVGSVNNGQQAEVKLETFPFTRYGTVPATVSNIAADAVVHEGSGKDKDGNANAGGAVFPATLTLAKDTIIVDGKRIKLAPGMNLRAEIKTGRRRVIEYLLRPVQTYAQESLRER